MCMVMCKNVDVTLPVAVNLVLRLRINRLIGGPVNGTRPVPPPPTISADSPEWWRGRLGAMLGLHGEINVYFRDNYY